VGIRFQTAETADFPAIIALMNAAFRGAKGWSLETSYIDGQRTNESLLSEEIGNGAIYLLVKDDQVLQACVSVKALSPHKWYLGALTVSPALQKAGLGRQILEAAEAYVAQRGARTIEITVLNVREALIAWYDRRGYRRTGAKRPFPYGDARFGKPTRDDLEFFVFERNLGQ
jgi:ribosomal protein S18 acetylase RimI-like enzyme